ncbi:MAG: hypothetical protein HC841_02025, partial [Verrucomicrobiae bacterium]|nr:hypothetical protein [Verrucomicrobiae bacterium]
WNAGTGQPRAGVFRFARSGGTSQPLRVEFTTYGTATEGMDYVAFEKAVVIPAGLLSTNLSVLPLNDTTNEFRETINVVLRPLPGYQIGATNQAAVFIDDDEGAAFEWETVQSFGIIADTNRSAEIVFRRQGSVKTVVDHEILLQLANGTATLNAGSWLFNGNIVQQQSGGLGIIRTWVRFPLNSEEARVRVTVVAAPPGSPVGSPYQGPTLLTVPSLFGSAHSASPSARWATSSARGSSRPTWSRGAGPCCASAVRRPAAPPMAWRVRGFVDVPFTVRGSATHGADYTAIGTNIVFGPGLLVQDLPVSIFTTPCRRAGENLYVDLDTQGGFIHPDATLPDGSSIAALNLGDPAAVSPPSFDRDSDGLPDDWELAHGRSPFVHTDAYADADGDGVSDIVEANLGSNPNSRDSDNDGASDYEEWVNGSDPQRSQRPPLRRRRGLGAHPPEDGELH